ncbi:MAG: DUF4303 domain-containing protein [Tannerellaceae bacterium]|nr:DUF4303 domain-containing protein [Tannerellaceae bacterium]
MEFKNYESFKRALKQTTKETFALACEAFGKEGLSGFALFSDESAMTMSVIVNTVEYLEEAVREYPEEALYYKFTPDEWKDDAFASEYLDTLNDWLVEKHEELVGHAFVEHRDIIFRIAVEVLEELKEENLFAGTNSTFVLLFAVSDSFDEEFMLNNFKRLNSGDLLVEYEEYIDAQEIYFDDEED